MRQQILYVLFHFIRVESGSVTLWRRQPTVPVVYHWEEVSSWSKAPREQRLLCCRDWQMEEDRRRRRRRNTLDSFNWSTNLLVQPPQWLRPLYFLACFVFWPRPSRSVTAFVEHPSYFLHPWINYSDGTFDLSSASASNGWVVKIIEESSNYLASISMFSVCHNNKLRKLHSSIFYIFYSSIIFHWVYFFNDHYSVGFNAID